MHSRRPFAKRLGLMNIGFTLVGWVLAMALATVSAYIYANIRGNLLPDGTIANDGPLSHWVGINFRYYLPPFLLVGSVLGVLVGQAQFWMWLKHSGSRDRQIRP